MTSSPSRLAPQVATPEVLARAEALYEQSRKRVSGRPPWAKLNPADPYDMGMRAEAIRQAESGVEARDLVAEAEIAFLAALSRGEKPAPYSQSHRDRGLTVQEHNARLDAMRAIDKGRQRARRKGWAVWKGGAWFITPAGESALALAQGAAPAGVNIPSGS